MKKIYKIFTFSLIIFICQSSFIFSNIQNTYKFQPIPLPYSYNALEPSISSETMTFHHDKHYVGYVNKLNATLENYPDLQSKTLEQLLTNLNCLPKEAKSSIINNGGGVYNHEFFFNLMSANHNTTLTGELKNKINDTYGSYDNFKNEFKKSALDLFGSGWTWLVIDGDNDLYIINTTNQDSPISKGLKPIICIDLWEHAYYLDYKNDRAKYIDNWFNVLDWSIALNNFDSK